VRYGAALALGIACAGTGMKEAITLLEPLTTDTTPFVRQGAFIALAMVLIQTSEQAEPKVKTIRQLFLDTAGDKHQAVMAKFGAIVALGIIDAGA
jgi:26S proteasome regulatory subunit N2